VEFVEKKRNRRTLQQKSLQPIEVAYLMKEEVEQQRIALANARNGG
jgi:hypothetical protein